MTIDNQVEEIDPQYFDSCFSVWKMYQYSSKFKKHFMLRLLLKKQNFGKVGWENYSKQVAQSIWFSYISQIIVPNPSAFNSTIILCTSESSIIESGVSVFLSEQKFDTLKLSKYWLADICPAKPTTKRKLSLQKSNKNNCLAKEYKKLVFASC